MKEIVKKEVCCGCSACFNVCPVNAISMTENIEGFLYPLINENCVDCGECKKVCPVINVKPDIPFNQYGYVVQNKDKVILRESTSGGAFTAIAEYVIENNGIVYGAAFDNDFTVKHIGVDSKDELYKFRNSKYVQSNVGYCYARVKEHLDKGKMVLFSGTPCQAEGLKFFLKKEYENLIIADVVCRAVPSPLVLDKYLKFRSKSLDDQVIKVVFRDKFFGYKYSSFSMYDQKMKNIYHEGIDTDEFLRAFFSNICDRKSCYNCKFKKRYRISDYTLWDCFNVEDYFKEIDNDNGATKLLIHTNKGLRHFENFKSKLMFKEIDADRLVENTKEMFVSVETNSNRELFFQDLNSLNEEQLFKKYFPVGLSSKFEKAIRKIGVKTGMYKYIRIAYKKLFGDRKR